jgi:ribosomal protein L7/L12
MLEKAFEIHREKVKPLFPYDPQTDTIHLPSDIKEELQGLIMTGQKIEAVKRVTELTGAGLRASKDYVDDLAKKR